MGEFIIGFPSIGLLGCYRPMSEVGGDNEHFFMAVYFIPLFSWPRYTHKVLGVLRKDLEKCPIPREFRQQSLHEGKKVLHYLAV